MSATNSTLSPPKNPAERRAWVIYQLRIRGTNLLRLSKQHGVSASAMQAALMVPSSHLERVIADALGLPVEKLFPERFDRDGRRLHLTRAPARKCKTREAA